MTERIAFAVAFGITVGLVAVPIWDPLLAVWVSLW
jgi:hypothetical protein